MKKRVFGFFFFAIGAILFLVFAIVAIIAPDVSFRALSGAISKNADKFKTIEAFYRIKNV